MQGMHAFEPKAKASIDLESFVAEDRFLRQIDRFLDLKSVRELTAARYERMWKMEGLFAEAKQNHCLARAKYRGRPKVQIQAYLIAIVQNVKRLLFPLYCLLLAHRWSYWTSFAPVLPSNQSRPSINCQNKNPFALFQQARSNFGTCFGRTDLRHGDAS